MLKSAIFCLLLLVCLQKSFGEEAKTYEEALKISKETNKQIFIYFGADWCSYCKKMENIFENESVSKELDQYVFLKINVEKNKSLAKKHDVKTIPDYMIINEEEDVIKRHTGYKNKTEFLDWLKN